MKGFGGAAVYRVFPHYLHFYFMCFQLLFSMEFENLGGFCPNKHCMAVKLHSILESCNASLCYPALPLSG